MIQDDISVSRRGPLAIITLERPDALNAITYPMIGAIERAARAAEADPEIAAICITGAGRGFCAGIDMSILADSAKGEGDAASGPAGPALFSFLLSVSKPVIAAVNGVSAGGGFVLAMMCDMRFMAEDANFTTVFARRGLVAEHGTSWLLPRIVGLSRALDILWSSRKVDAAEAWRIGLADRVVARADLIDAVAAYVEGMVASVSPRAVAIIKKQVLDHLEVGFEPAAAESATFMRQALVHPDAKEGARSFMERRTPRFAPWTGADST